MGHPRPLFRFFRIFKQKLCTSFTTNKCEQMLWPSSIRHQNLNPRPLEHESPPITTRPGLPPNLTSNLPHVQFYYCYTQLQIAETEHSDWMLQFMWLANQSALFLRCIATLKYIYFRWQWLWLSWQSGRFWHQRSAVQNSVIDEIF